MSDSFDYVTSRDTADRLITKFGQAVQIIRDIQSGPDYAPVLTPTPFDTFAAQVEFTLKQVQSGWVREGTERWIVAAGPLAAMGVTDVVPDNHISVGGVERKILVAKPLAPAGVVVMFDCQVAT